MIHSRIGILALFQEFGYVMENLPLLKCFTRLYRRMMACFWAFFGMFPGSFGRMLGNSELELYETPEENLVRPYPAALLVRLVHPLVALRHHPLHRRRARCRAPAQRA
jgi:hypothetical protein